MKDNEVNARATDEFTVRVSENPTKTKELLEVGFEYIWEKTGCYSSGKAKYLAKKV